MFYECFNCSQTPKAPVCVTEMPGKTNEAYQIIFKNGKLKMKN